MFATPVILLLLDLLIRLTILSISITESTIAHIAHMFNHLCCILRSQYLLCFAAQMEQLWVWLRSIPSVLAPGTAPVLASRFCPHTPLRTAEDC